MVSEFEKEDQDRGVSRKEVTKREIEKMMNDINEDLEFTTEMETDFENGRLPTLSFEMWCEKDGIHHSYYEKPMRSQV